MNNDEAIVAKVKVSETITSYFPSPSGDDNQSTLVCSFTHSDMPALPERIAFRLRAIPVWMLPHDTVIPLDLVAYGVILCGREVLSWTTGRRER